MTPLDRPVEHLQLADSELHWRSEFTDPPRLDVVPITYAQRGPLTAGGRQ